MHQPDHRSVAHWPLTRPPRHRFPCDLVFIFSAISFPASLRSMLNFTIACSIAVSASGASTYPIVVAGVRTIRHLWIGGGSAMASISASRKGKPSGHRAVTDFELDGNVSQLSNTALWPQVAPLGPFFLPPVGFYRRRIYFR